MDTNGKVFRNSASTLGTKLSCIFGRNFDYFSSSFRRFEVEYIKKLKPSYISHRPIETVITIPRVHLFNTDSIILFKKLISNLKMKIPSLVSNPLIGFGNKYPRLLSSVRTFNSTRKPLLPHSKNILGFLKEVGVFYPFIFRGSEETLTANINTNYLASLRKWL